MEQRQRLPLDHPDYRPHLLLRLRKRQWVREQLRVRRQRRGRRKQRLQLRVRMQLQ